MKLKRILTEPVILACVAFVDLTSISALIVCHMDVTNKEAQAAVEQRILEAVSVKTAPVSTEMMHYTPATINSLLHPVSVAKFRAVAHRPLPNVRNQ